MRHSTAMLLFFVLAILLSLTASGCLEKTIYPALITTVVSVTPSELQPSNGTGTLELPNTVISLRSETQVPAKLIRYRVTYSTPLGETIESLRIPDTPADQYLTPGTANEIQIRPYTKAVLELFELSPSNIEPIRATITMTIKDENENITYPEAHCLLYAPDPAT